MGKQRRTVDSREVVRFRELIGQLERQGVNQSEIARRMASVAKDGASISQSYVNLIKRANRPAQGLGADIVRMVRDAFGIDPAYFFEDYEGVKDYKIYSLDNRRVEKQLRDYRTENDAKIAALLAEVDALKAAQSKRDMEEAKRLRPPAVPTPPRRPRHGE